MESNPVRAFPWKEQIARDSWPDSGVSRLEHGQNGIGERGMRKNGKATERDGANYVAFLRPRQRKHR
jgi:hypothetical protein